MYGLKRKLGGGGFVGKGSWEEKDLLGGSNGRGDSDGRRWRSDGGV